MDEEIVGGDPPHSSFGNVMTTWHSDWSMAEALDFFLADTNPDESFMLRTIADLL